ncbi:MAG: Type I restriction enzyme StySPI specificity protein, partial [uncultured bacterium]
FWFLQRYEITRGGGRGGNQPALNGLKVGEFPVAMPPQKEQQEIVKRVKELFDKADRIEERYKKAKTFTDKLTQSILNKAFKGELVPQDTSDEPASALLERIRAVK